MADIVTVGAVHRLEVSVDSIEIGAKGRIEVRNDKPIKLGKNDSYVLAPYQSATSINYTIPSSVTDGLVTLDKVKADLTQEIADRELAFVAATQYTDTTVNNTKTQTLAEVEANYIDNGANGTAHIMGLDFSNAQIATVYDNQGIPTGQTATFQQLHDQVISVSDNNASLTNDVAFVVNDYAASGSNLTTLQATVAGNTASITSAESVAVEANGWAAGASKLITGPDGKVTGWSFGDGSNVQSSFGVYADNFFVGNAATGKKVFEVNQATNKIKMTSDVEVDGNLTVINNVDGGSITTGKIQSSDTNTFFDLANNQIKMDNGSGFVLNSTAAGTSVEPNIQGAYINGGSITGSYLDLLSFKILSEVDGNFGSIQPASAAVVNFTATSGCQTSYTSTFYSPTYGSGYIRNRIPTTSTKFLINYTTNTNVGSLTYSVNSGSWLTLDSAGSGAFFQSFTFSSTIRFRLTACTTGSGFSEKVAGNITVTAILEPV